MPMSSNRRFWSHSIFLLLTRVVFCFGGFRVRFPIFMAKNLHWFSGSDKENFIFDILVNVQHDHAHMVARTSDNRSLVFRFNSFWEMVSWSLLRSFCGTKLTGVWYNRRRRNGDPNQRGPVLDWRRRRCRRLCHLVTVLVQSWWALVIWDGRTGYWVNGKIE